MIIMNLGEDHVENSYIVRVKIDLWHLPVRHDRWRLVRGQDPLARCAQGLRGRLQFLLVLEDNLLLLHSCSLRIEVGPLAAVLKLRLGYLGLGTYR